MLSRDIDKILLLQNQRAIVYKELEKQFKNTIDDKLKYSSYMQLCKDVMEKFQSISNEMRSISETSQDGKIKTFISKIQLLSNQTSSGVEEIDW